MFNKSKSIVEGAINENEPGKSKLADVHQTCDNCGLDWHEKLNTPKKDVSVPKGMTAPTHAGLPGGYPKVVNVYGDKPLKDCPSCGSQPWRPEGFLRQRPTGTVRPHGSAPSEKTWEIFKGKTKTMKNPDPAYANSHREAHAEFRQGHRLKRELEKHDPDRVKKIMSED